MAGYGDKPFGLRDVKLTNLAGTSQVDLPVGRILSFKERVKSGELSGDDQIAAVVAISEAVEWSLEAGGISLEAYALMTGRSVSTASSSPTETTTLTGDSQEAFPYFKIYGKSVDEDAASDIHCKIYKAKIMEALEGEFADGEFVVSKCSGIGIDDGSNGVFDFVQNETAAALPGS